MSNKGSEEITLTTSKNWVLPPRPKIKKGKKSENEASTGDVSSATAAAATTNVVLVNKHVKQDPGKGKIKINSQIHSNINLLTNNRTELHAQLQSVTKENCNLKKVLAKLNQEIQGLRLLQEGGKHKPRIAVRVEGIDNNECKRLKTEEGEQSIRAMPIMQGIGRIGLGHIVQDSVKTATFLSPKDILINPLAMESRRSIVKQEAPAALSPPIRSKKKREPKEPKEPKVPKVLKVPKELKKAAAKEHPDLMDIDMKETAPSSVATTSSHPSNTHPPDVAADWFAKNSFMDFDVYNEDLADPSSSQMVTETPTSSFMLGENVSKNDNGNAGAANNSPLSGNPSTTGNDVLASPKFGFGFEDNDDFIMY
ncbi:DEKNAAC105225 [Brettanomyces naardenensis]|uniref:DEKNAAC105225 n=1 Tax=Brettanomyces naardenensis TaxID=13370 RepID=A0A448YT42_BRENA|nr:DEKNAAC105225 [Brettanomyces naardenensis]